MSFSFGSSKEKTQQQKQSDPWDVAAPYIKNFLGELPGMEGVTPDQSAAFDQLKQNAAQGNPFADDITNLANSLYGSESRAPQVGAAFDDFSRRLTPTADGTNLDIENNPYIQQILQQTTDSAVNNINSQFAAAGRDFSGANQTAIARGITQAQLPVLADLYSQEQGRTDAAARDLFNAGTGTATTQANLDQLSATLRSMGIDVGNEAMNARNYTPNTMLEIEEQRKNLPFVEASKLAELLYGAGLLGKQETASGTQKKTGFGLGLEII